MIMGLDVPVADRARLHTSDLSIASKYVTKSCAYWSQIRAHEIVPKRH